MYIECIYTYTKNVTIDLSLSRYVWICTYQYYDYCIPVQMVL